MSGGGKGGSSTTQVQIPAWLERAAQSNLARADALARIGYTPYYGPDVAAFTPMQQAAMQNTNQAALSFGMAAPTDAMAGIPMAQTFAGGLQGYSSAPIYQQSLDALAAARPGQFAAMNAPFIDPVTGAQPFAPFGTGQMPGPQGFDWTQPVAAPVAAIPMQSSSDTRDRPATMPNPRGSLTGGNIFSGLSSFAPGGVNTRNPSSVVNTVAAKATSRPQSAPTAANRPAANPKR